MFRILTVAGLIAASLIGSGAQAAEAGPVLVHRINDSGNFGDFMNYPITDNLVGGFTRDQSGSLMPLTQRQLPAAPIDRDAQEIQGLNQSH